MSEATKQSLQHGTKTMDRARAHSLIFQAQRSPKPKRNKPWTLTFGQLLRYHFIQNMEQGLERSQRTHMIDTHTLPQANCLTFRMTPVETISWHTRGEMVYMVVLYATCEDSEREWDQKICRSEQSCIYLRMLIVVHSVRCVDVMLEVEEGPSNGACDELRNEKPPQRVPTKAQINNQIDHNSHESRGIEVSDHAPRPFDVEIIEGGHDEEHKRLAQNTELNSLPPRPGTVLSHIIKDGHLIVNNAGVAQVRMV